MTPSDESRPSPRYSDCTRPLSRRAYALTGVSLMLVKYGVEFAVIYQLTGRLYTPLDFINPLLSSRRLFLEGAPDWFGMAWLVWTLPFVAIAAAFSMRRAIDAGWTPWLALFILLPYVNNLLMITLALVPGASERRPSIAGDGPPPSPETAGRIIPSKSRPPVGHPALSAKFYGVAFAAVYAFGTAMLSIYLLDSYGATLFFGTPLLAGVVASFAYNLRQDQRWLPSVGVAMLPAIVAGGLFLLFALEGIICLAMAAPIVLPMAALGGVLGKAFADAQRFSERQRRDMLGCLVVLPLVAFVESRLPNDAEYVVVTSVDVAAAPEVVWRKVVDFPPIDSPRPWLFRWGIAGPESATIAGRGVGAVRRCNFTTGSFVEPITAWDEPRRLAFDVTEQPEPMFELSPYRHIHPPHLKGSFRSTRGEFVLEPLPGGKTRLVGRTWYRLELAPHGYWTVWTDWIVHRIHGRVLEHVKMLAEQDA
jgi:hypothetical protein